MVLCMLVALSAILRATLLRLFLMSLGRGLVIDAEILAELHGVLFAYSHGWTNVWVESDSELAVKVLSSRGRNITWRVRAYCANFAVIRPSITLPVSQIYRDDNPTIDLLAKLHTHNIWIVGCPDFICDKLYTDMNKYYFRAAA